MSKIDFVNTLGYFVLIFHTCSLRDQVLVAIPFHIYPQDYSLDSKMHCINNISKLPKPKSLFGITKLCRTIPVMFTLLLLNSYQIWSIEVAEFISNLVHCSGYPYLPSHHSHKISLKWLTFCHNTCL